MKPLDFPAKRLIRWTIGGALALPLSLFAQTTDISNGPLGQPATSVSPNLMLILDDSGSMARQFTPDYISTYSTPSGTVVTRNCFDTLDGDNALTANPSECWAGDPPAMSPDFNVQYYNPEIRYMPAVDFDGTPRMSMTCENTGGVRDASGACVGGWTRVPTDNVSASTMNKARKNLHSGGAPGSAAGNWGMDASPVITEMDLVGSFPDRVWCMAQGDVPTDTARCRTNSGYTYPDVPFGYGLDIFGRRKYKLGAPYYYRIVPTEYCTDATLKTCVASETPTIVSGVSYNVPAPVRFCTDSTRTDCQAKRDAITGTGDTRTALYPKYLGEIIGAGVSAVAAQGKITITSPQADTAQGNITSIMVNGVNILGGALTLPAGGTANSWASAIANAIQSAATTPDYTASATNNVVTVVHPVIGAAGNGVPIAVNVNVTSRSPASITINITNTQRSNTSPNWGTVSSLIIDGLQFVTGTIVCNLTGCNSSSATTRNATMASLIRSGLVPPSGWTVSGSGNQVVITAPSGTGSEKNNFPVAMTTSRTSATDAATGSATLVLKGGVTTGDVNHTTQNFSGGSDPSQHASVGRFVRTNIVPGQSYNKHPARSDCLGEQCTYEEEMTNFANWFAYYRTRLQMAKTAIGRAFIGLSDNFRVGFMTINFNTTYYRAVAPFTTGAGGEKALWYQRLYAAEASGGTPLKTALSRAGRYFGNQNPDAMGATPINSACQPNYAILTSDGYWNDTGGAVSLSGVNLNDADGDGSPNTLADVAHYYYNTDLSTATTGPGAGFKNQVPASGIDIAPHQHMTTFTVGMGVSGSLLFHPNYLEKGNSIDYDAIYDGDSTTPPNQWPRPIADTETTIDDMWHAAVNGRGRFFSAQNPIALANGLTEVLTSVQRRIGAGAAAATSNLQPVAGDNFAFTAQYQTVEWSGDLKARTIGLTDGVISARELWSAQAQLDQRTDLNRKIYTFDPADTDSTATVVVSGANRTQNANRLRSFCRTDAPLGTNPTCDDGGLLTQQEMDDYFDPLGGVNGALLQTGTWPTGDPRLAAATKGSLVRYLRGETANEMTIGGTAVTDLYRNRAHLLGDIVNAQPAYVKNSPFSYSAATDPYYIDFRNSTNGTSGNRKGSVYVAANDGMLHAFETDPDNVPYYQNAGVSTPDLLSDDTFVGTLNTDPIVGEGAERWAYVPSMLFATLKRLAEENYATNHRFYADGSPQVGDVCFGHTLSTPCGSVNAWHTILVGGLNAGGRGYYALDITNPDLPKGLWEIRGGAGTQCLTDAEANSGSFGEDCNIGLTFGNPIITKRPSDGRWVVLFTSGYNNVSPGDGRGYLYILDAQTGRILRRMTTGVGDATTPSGLARINAWVNNALLDNTALAVYGGDLQGNLWRFQLDDTPQVPRGSVTLLATVRDPSNVPQPITVRPELGEVDGNRVVFFGTGRFLGESDKTNNQRQTIYAIKDTMVGTTTVHDMTRGPGIPGFIQQTLSESGTDTRVVSSSNAVDFSADSGWYIDLPDGGVGEEAAERVNVDPVLQLGTLVVPSNVPSTETCVAGGFGWLNFLDFRTGATVQNGLTDTPVSVRVAGSLIVGINVVKIGNAIKTIVTTADNQQITKETPVVPTSISGRRTTWRELFVE